MTKTRALDLVEARLARGDVLLVCSDGLSGVVTDEVIRCTLRDAPSPDAAAEALIARANEAGGPDNVTCIVARIEGEGLSAPVADVSCAKACLAPEPIPEAARAEAPARRAPRGMLERLAAVLGW